MVDLDPRLRLSRRQVNPRSCCGQAWTQAYLRRAPYCAGHAVSDLDSQGGLRHPGPFCVRLWCLLRSDHCAAAGIVADYFAGPNLAAVTGLHYTSSVLGPLVGPAAFGYSVDLWHSDVIASCVATVCLVAAGYFFGAKPPLVLLRRTSLCGRRPSYTKMRGFIGFSNGRPLAMPTA